MKLHLKSSLTDSLTFPHGTITFLEQLDGFSVLVETAKFRGSFIKKEGGENNWIDVTEKKNCPVGWGCRIHRLLLCRGVRPPPNEFPGYDTKQSDGEVPAMQELWGIQSTPLLPSLPGPL